MAPCESEKQHTAPCHQFVWFRGAVVSLAVFAFGLFSGIAGIIWHEASKTADRVTASEAQWGRMEERLTAMQASQARMERSLELLAARSPLASAGPKGATP